MDLELNQTAVYWAFSSVDGWSVKTYTDPVEIDCRWEDKQILFRDRDGNEVMSEAMIYVGQDVTLKGCLKLGGLTDLESDDSPANNGGREIRSFQKVPDLAGSEYVRKVMI